jgi:SRSO17 transposase
VPYQQAMETEAAQRNMHLYLQGLLSHLLSKNAEDIATFVDIERQVIQAFIGTAPWDHRPLIQVLVGEVVERLGAPDGIIAFDPSSFPKRGIHSVGGQTPMVWPSGQSRQLPGRCLHGLRC